MTLWVVGRVRGALPSGAVAWDIVGIFSGEVLALLACRSPEDFAAPLVLNRPLPASVAGWPGCHYPLAEGA